MDMSIPSRGQRMASELSASNPDLIESIRRSTGRPGPGGNNDNSSSQNGNSNPRMYHDQPSSLLFIRLDSSNNSDQNKPSSS